MLIFHFLPYFFTIIINVALSFAPSADCAGVFALYAFFTIVFITMTVVLCLQFFHC